MQAAPLIYVARLFFPLVFTCSSKIKEEDRKTKGTRPDEYARAVCGAADLSVAPQSARATHVSIHCAPNMHRGGFF